MRRRVAGCAVGLVVAGHLLSAAPASAYSCALPDVRTWLGETERADGAYAAVVGTVLDRRGTLDVEVLLEGSATDGLRIDYDDSFDGGGQPWRVGDEVPLAGVVTAPGVMAVGPCGIVTPSAVREVAEPVPAPDGSGPPAFLATTDLRGGELALLDARGRSLGWAPAPDARLEAVCPGGGTVVTTSTAAWGTVFWERTLEVRGVSDLTVDWRTGKGPYGGAVCEDPDGARVLAVRLDPNGYNRVRAGATGESLVAEGVDPALSASPVGEGAHVQDGAVVVDGVGTTSAGYAFTAVVPVRGTGPVAQALTVPPVLAAQVWRPSSTTGPSGPGPWARSWPLVVGVPAVALLVVLVVLRRRRGGT